MLKSAGNFECKACKHPVFSTSPACNSVVIDDDVIVEKADKFCYVGDMLCNQGGAYAAVRERVCCGWIKIQGVGTVLSKDSSNCNERKCLWQLCQ